MPTQANALPPSLINEISDIKRRLAAVERAPAPETKFDRYPSVEWHAESRPAVGGNVWASAGLANVTGLVFDRVEVKFLTDWILRGRSEAEVRLAAFEHTDVGTFQCISATDTWRISGETNRTVRAGRIRWTHQIDYGWDYSNDTSIYTIELQHRYPNGMLPRADPAPKGTDVLAFTKAEGANPDPQLGQYGMYYDSGSNTWTYGIGSRPNPSSWGWVNVARPAPYWNVWDGTFSISNMHYCVGLPPERLADATDGGTFVYQGANNWSKARDADPSEPHF
jgi:hypothetical protein